MNRTILHSSVAILALLFIIAATSSSDAAPYGPGYGRGVHGVHDVPRHHRHPAAPVHHAAVPHAHVHHGHSPYHVYGPPVPTVKVRPPYRPYYRPYRPVKPYVVPVVPAVKPGVHVVVPGGSLGLYF